MHSRTNPVYDTLKPYVHSSIIFMTLHHFREVVSQPRTSWQLSLLGVLAGTCAACVIILFRLAYEQLQLLLLPELGAFDALPWWGRLGLPFLGIFAIYLVATSIGFSHYRVGIPFAIHRMSSHFGLMPLRSTINQFFGGVFAIASGFFVGREGPSVHLGASGSSFIGDGLKLPYNCIRIMAGCGIAAGISASFNTPFAAMIFVMEVVLRDYRIHVFIPIMLAAAIGSVLTRMIFGDGTVLLFLAFTSIDSWIYLYLIVFGLGLGALAAFFNHQLMVLMRTCQTMSLAKRFLIAALFTGCIGVFIPDAMGGEFLSVHALLNSNVEFQTLFVIFLAKFVLGCVAIGLGIPGGLIGPVMIIGMFAGALLAYPLQSILATNQYHDTFVLLGVAGMLAAVINAPMAALSAVMELSYAPQIILPCILVIVPAYIMSHQVCKNRSIFIQQLELQGLPYRHSAITQNLQRTGVLALAQTNIHIYAPDARYELVQAVRAQPDDYYLIRSINPDYYADVNAHDRFAENAHSLELAGPFDYQLATPNTTLESMHAESERTPLLFSPIAILSYQNTLSEVYDLLKVKRQGAVLITCPSAQNIHGIITWNSLHAYLFQQDF